mmetsp:Transcript_10568/g.16022  ORF Transcript_10568/g.16022 Transcript_10568/m.16022 type:complete len:137 (-) Transcript_10568:136-546(-)|eukprot:CAMPEP_0185023462 /NCGR_PEP_ID=MMETSP1103-20130426/6136_1 /TAXON_ID=36769 /ORGANISM="Paraphysomonas bandaiensis, Strain Caron Lab Isolate" /LENGTH=136 /DNA_ID=CAMNT_0027556065 /DNA_START=95 /DNA_END=505 /DNA_ORIENTATION=-
MFITRSIGLSSTRAVQRLSAQRSLSVLAEGVEFDTIAREWRCKWSPSDEKASLVNVQKLLSSCVGDIQQVGEGVKVQRVVCGTCHDFKVIISLPTKEFKAWGEKNFEPEATFLAKAGEIPGITCIETQTYTLMKVI